MDTWIHVFSMNLKLPIKMHEPNNSKSRTFQSTIEKANEYKVTKIDFHLYLKSCKNIFHSTLKSQVLCCFITDEIALSPVKSR